MANTIGRQLLVNGSRNYVMKFTVVGDASGEETGTLVNVATGDMGTDNKIWKIEYSTVGCSAQLLFDATTDLFAVGLSADFTETMKFEKEGGLINNAGAGKTGDILITTAGLGAGDSITILLHVKKK